MMSLRFIAAVGLVTAGLAAQDARTVTEPSFPPVCTSLDAQLSAGPTGLPSSSETQYDTSRIQNALDSCASTGQAVELRSSGSNNAFLTAPIRIPPAVTLLVDAGVTVYASRNPRDYDANSSQSCGTIAASGSGCVALINVNRSNGAAIMGYGVIDGRGYLPLLVNGAPSNASWWDLADQANTQKLNQNCPRLLQVNNTNGFTLYKITLMNSPNFHVSLGTDTNFTAWGVKIIAPYDARNTDGIDPGYSSNVTITNSHISDGDDNVAVGGGNPPGAMNISVVNNFFGNGHGASIGSLTQNGVSNVLFDHITIAGEAADTNQNGIRIKSDVSRGGLVQNITYSNFCMRNVRHPIVFDPFYTSGATGNLIPSYQNIVLNNVHATTEGLILIEGHDPSVATTISLSNVQVDNVKSSDITEEYTTYTLGPDPVNFGSLLKGTGVTVVDNVSTSNPPLDCPDSIFAPVMGELIPGPAQIESRQALTLAVQVIPTKEITYRSYLAALQSNPAATLALPRPTGTVTIYDGSSAVGTTTLGDGATTSIPVTIMGAGMHTLTASYSGDANYPAFTFGSYNVSATNHRLPRR
ncbi:MAG TPA: glycosyl hydrolase family 28 protein [Bryobacteraceae bacterium]|nr:glycosyl hydrolase family 28 protein [Bryobacteraceae bacterium]